MLRLVKIFLIWTVALWGLVGAFHNIADWNGTLGAVGAVTSMSTFDGTDKWQATSSSVVIWLGALFIMFSKLVATVLCTLGSYKMWQAKYHNANSFNQSKALALAGCGIAIFMLFAGFIVIAESWFELWRSDAMRGPVLDSAFRYAGLIALIAIFVANKDD